MNSNMRIFNFIVCLAAWVGDRNTSLVDTVVVSREVAPKSALEFYERLVDSGVILPGLRDDLALGGFAFPLRDDF
ncbi:hypothetical protein [Burkholderia ubonensis]|uniref:hypothetical protein n=1 Tax=Burkholderia ubonensis TaxID=101571 RepID=UPI0012FA74D4|nr:hypothetical protein [Burkholderia ubonensis]